MNMRGDSFATRKLILEDWTVGSILLDGQLICIVDFSDGVYFS